MESRKIKKNGITPSNSFLIHPATLKFLKQNQDKENNLYLNNTKTSDVFLTPEISFNPKTILEFYNIKYINELENYIDQDYTNQNKIRLIKLFFYTNKNIKNLNQNYIPNIINFLSSYYNLSHKQIENKLSDIKDKNFEDIFHK